MVFTNCTVCSVYGTDNSSQTRVRVKCIGEQITLYLMRQKEVPEGEKVRIDFYDERIGCVKTYCELRVRQNNDSAAREPWIADCDILEVAEIIQDRRVPRAKTEKETIINSFEQGEISAVIYNISVGGLYFVTTTRLTYADTIEFSYCFMEKEYRLRATVLREEDFKDGNLGYGCQFTELPKGAKRDIQQYVFQRQNGGIW